MEDIGDQSWRYYQHKITTNLILKVINMNATTWKKLIKIYLINFLGKDRKIKGLTVLFGY